MTILSFEEAKRHYAGHHCRDMVGCCTHRFDYSCTSCGAIVAAYGEDMLRHSGLDGVCEMCRYRVSQRLESEATE